MKPIRTKIQKILMKENLKPHSEITVDGDMYRSIITIRYDLPNFINDKNISFSSRMTISNRAATESMINIVIKEQYNRFYANLIEILIQRDTGYKIPYLDIITILHEHIYEYKKEHFEDPYEKEDVL